ncbi:MAG: PKD domain-containing protein [Flavisolibacter sp.]
MRPIYLLLTLAACSFLSLVQAQDLAGFTYTIDSGHTVSFTNASVISSPGDHRALWIFGDGQQQLTPALASTWHHYATDGSYRVCLKIYRYTGTHDSVFTADICKTIILSSSERDSCTAAFESFAASNTALTTGFVAHPWESQQKRPEKICWDFGDHHDTCVSYNPGSSANYALYHHYGAPGGYKVCVTIFYAGGCQSSSCQEIRTGEAPSCKVTYRTETPSNHPLTRYFIAQPWHSQQQLPVRICWHFGDGKDSCVQYPPTAGQQYVIRHDYAHAGKDSVCLGVLFAGGCEAHYCQVETLTGPDTHPDTCAVRWNEVQTDPSNLERRFYLILSEHRTPQKICWHFGDGSDTCLSGPLSTSGQYLMMPHGYPAPGRYEPCVSVSYQDGCTARYCHVLEIAPGRSTVCGGYMTDSLISTRTLLFRGYSASGAGDPVTRWRWVFGDGQSADGREVKHEFARGGSYRVCLGIVTTSGCETSICRTLQVMGGDLASPLQLSPNPVIRVLHAVFRSTHTETCIIRVYSAGGVLLRTYTREAQAGMNSWDFDLGNLPTGWYSLVVQSAHQLASAVFFRQ